MQETQGTASTEPKSRDAGLNQILRAKIEDAEKRYEEGSKKKREERKPSETPESEASKPTEKEPKAKGSDDGDGKSQPKEADEGKGRKAEKSETSKVSKDEESSESSEASKAGETDEKTEISDKGKKPDKSDTEDADKPKPKKAKEDSVDPDKPFAPKTWTEEERAAFEEAPEHVQQAVTKLVKNLQAGFTKKTMALADAQRVAEDITAAIQPHQRERMKQAGLSEGKLLAQLLSWQDAYLQDPANMVQGLIKQARLTPDQLGFGAPQRTEAQPDEGQAHVDPEVAKLQQELAALKSVWTQATQSAQQRQVQEQQRTLTDAQTAIQQFSSAVDETGNALHPHFERVWARMLPAINEMNGDPEKAKLPHQEKLRIAYEDAVWADPDYRKQHQAAEQKRVEAKLAAAQEEARKKALEDLEKQRAKSAASVKPKIGSGTNPNGRDKKLSLDELLAANANKFGL